MMSWVRRLCSLLLVCLACAVIFRGDVFRELTLPGLTCWSDRDDFHAGVRLDETFTEEERRWIIAAFDSWRAKTGGIVDLQYVGTTPHRSIFGPIFFASGMDVKVFRVNRFEAIVWPRAIVGYTGYNAFVLMPSRIESDTEIYGVALHEVGHLLELEHSENSDDLMYPSCKKRGCVDTEIAFGDLTQFCREVNRLKRGIRRNGLR